MQDRIIKNKKVLVTGGAGFIGSNLCEELVKQDNHVVCLDNFSTGFKHNIQDLIGNSNFTLIEGDIRNYEDCQKAVKGVDVVLHQAALGSVPRSIKDPMTTTDVNIGGFVKMLFASKEEGVKRFVYAASSSTYGDHPDLPKIEDKIGNPLSPYAITKFANELYAKNFSKIYGIETIGLRYFNVFGRRQDPNGAYAAVIPKFVKLLIDHHSPVINGDGTHSRDFTYIDNVIQINQLAAISDKKEAINQVFNVACGENNNLNQMVDYLKEYLSFYDPQIKHVETIHGPEREGDIKHSLASIGKAKKLLGYNPTHLFKDGLKEAVNWYWENLR
jgi:UDP-N-acetylglucosamine 4-epimerase